MKDAILAACGALFVAGTVALSAQTPARPATPSPATQPVAPTRAEEKTVTVTGCLKTLDAAMSPTGAAPSSASTPSAGTSVATRYVLTNVESDMTSGSSSGSAAAVATQYAVTADSTSVNLSPHVNHKVRITGKATPASPTAAPSSSTATGTRPTDPERTGDRMAAMPKPMATLAATSLTMVSATCATTSLQ